jgi:hypothetical protein
MPVYFAMAGDKGPVKIGYASDPRKRLAMLQTSSEKPLRFVRLLDGGANLERYIHSLLNSKRIAREWFELSEQDIARDFGAPDLEFEHLNQRKRRHPIALPEHCFVPSGVGLDLEGQLIFLARSLSAIRGVGISTISGEIFKDSRTLDRVLSGGSLTVRNFEKAMRWFSSRWPTEQAWPQNVMRLAPFASEAA